MQCRALRAKVQEEKAAVAGGISDARSIPKQHGCNHACWVSACVPNVFFREFYKFRDSLDVPTHFLQKSTNLVCHEGLFPVSQPWSKLHLEPFSLRWMSLHPGVRCFWDICLGCDSWMWGPNLNLTIMFKESSCDVSLLQWQPGPPGWSLRIQNVGGLKSRGNCQQH